MPLDRADPPKARIVEPEEEQKGLLTIVNNAKKEKTPEKKLEMPTESDAENLKMMKRQTALAIKREIRKGELTLKELIDKFYELEENYLIKEYNKGLFLHFTYAVSMAPKVIKDEETGERCISIDDLLKYMLSKKSKVRRDQTVEICEGDSDIEAIRFISFIKLHILASCGGDKSKLGARNFKKLMKHMEVLST